MNKDMTFSIPKRYIIKKHQVQLPLSEAERELALNRNRYTVASRNGDDATLTGYGFVCPFCGEETPAHQQNFTDAVFCKELFTPDEYHSFFTPVQMSLFEEESNTTAELAINPPLYGVLRGRYTTPITCPQCGERSEHWDFAPPANIRLVKSKNRITLTYRQIADPSTALFMPWCDPLVLHPGRISETVIFNFDKGCTRQIMESDGKVISVRNLLPMEYKHSYILPFIATNAPFKSALYQAFENEWGTALPCTLNTIMPFDFIIFTKFVGYCESFYSGIPYSLSLGNGQLHPSFKAVAGKLHKASLAPRLYRCSAMPQSKAIKRSFYENPSLFFYIRELEQLWDICRNQDDFQQFLQDVTFSSNYSVLLFLHEYPATFAFLKDYIHIGKHRLKDAVMYITPIKNTNYVLRYSAMSNSMKKEEQRLWAKNLQSSNNGYISCPTIIPKNAPDLDMRVGTYVFRRMDNIYNCHYAGQQLNNCLNGSAHLYTPVYGVFHHDRIVAAVEIRGGNRVSQAKLKNNAFIYTEPEIERAILQWMEAKDLCWHRQRIQLVNEPPYYRHP